MARRLRKKNLRYSVIPAWQIHKFLDWDRPFPHNTLPTIELAEKNPKQFNSRGAGGVVEGRLTFQGCIRSLKRKLYRKTLGKEILQHASGIHVFSDFEKSQICKLVRLPSPNFVEMTYGTLVEKRSVGEDQFHVKGVKNIVFWGRVDFYYKGLDQIMEGIALAKNRGISAPFIFWICGPDYNEGYRKVQEHIDKNGVKEYVRILKVGDYTPGTVGLLKRADFCILASRWDGYSRTLRESVALGVPFISNRESHFDKVSKKFNNGLLFDNTSDLADILKNLNSSTAVRVRKAAKENSENTRNYFAWRECAQHFLKGLRDISY